MSCTSFDCLVIVCPLSKAVSSADLEATFSLLSRTSYSWEELQQRPLPHGVDPARIEAYLDTLAFQVSNEHCEGELIFKFSFLGEIFNEQG